MRRIVDAEIPVMGHIGLTPQSVHRMGGYKVQGKTMEAMDELRTDAMALEEAGCFALVLEGVPRELARMVTEELQIPTIGIGAGPDCDGQILVLHDMMTMTFSDAGQVCAALRGCGGRDASGAGRVQARCGGEDVSFGCGELPSLAGDAGVDWRSGRGAVSGRSYGHARLLPSVGRCSRVCREILRAGARVCLALCRRWVLCMKGISRWCGGRGRSAVWWWHRSL